MKRFVIIIIVLITFLGIVLILSNQNGYEKITLEEFNSKIEQKETFAFVLSQTSCPACTNYKKSTLSRYNKDIPVYVFDFDTVFTSEMQVYQFIEDYNLDIQRFYPNKSGISTPTTYVVKNGVVYNASVGAMDLQDLNSFIEDELQ